MQIKVSLLDVSTFVCTMYMFCRFSPDRRMKFRFFCLEPNRPTTNATENMERAMSTSTTRFRWLRWAGKFWSMFKTTLIHRTMRESSAIGSTLSLLPWTISKIWSKWQFLFIVHIHCILWMVQQNVSAYLHTDNCLFSLNGYRATLIVACTIGCTVNVSNTIVHAFKERKQLLAVYETQFQWHKPVFVLNRLKHIVLFLFAVSKRRQRKFCSSQHSPQLWAVPKTSTLSSEVWSNSKSS